MSLTNQLFQSPGVFYPQVQSSGALLFDDVDPNTIDPIPGEKFNTFINTNTGVIWKRTEASAVAPWESKYILPGGGTAGDVTNGGNIGSGAEFFDVKTPAGVLEFRTLDTNSLALDINTLTDTVRIDFMADQVDINELSTYGPLSIQNGGTGVTALEEGYTLRGQGGALTEAIAVRNIYDGATDPLPSDDSSLGFRRGSMWINTTNENIFMCMDPVNPAVWKQVDDVKTNYGAIIDPAPSDDENGGYSIGSIWLNTNTGAPWMCIDNTASAALWVSMRSPIHNEGNLAPDASFDVTQGYTVGSTFKDTNNSFEYICLENSPGTAKWHQLNAGPPPSPTVNFMSAYSDRSVNPTVTHDMPGGAGELWYGPLLPGDTGGLIIGDSVGGDFIIANNQQGMGLQYVGANAIHARVSYNAEISHSLITPGATFAEVWYSLVIDSNPVVANVASPVGLSYHLITEIRKDFTGVLTVLPYNVNVEGIVQVNPGDFLHLATRMGANVPAGTTTWTATHFTAEKISDV